ncbi:MAG: hypothetical protein ACHQUB_01310 [Candidatus Saccharimonadia bacterium]
MPNEPESSRKVIQLFSEHQLPMSHEKPLSESRPLLWAIFALSVFIAGVAIVVGSYGFILSAYRLPRNFRANFGISLLLLLLGMSGFGWCYGVIYWPFKKPDGSKFLYTMGITGTVLIGLAGVVAFGSYALHIV